jgi:3-isopropylmalate/(R)-2-methylmalate dehydratase small subunit
MKRFERVEGIVAPIDRADVDTDQIIPKQFLKRVERTGYGAFLFHDWRRRPDGSPDPDFVLNRAEFARAAILVAGDNFGCGSSREHAAWAIGDAGFRAVIAPGFADIFRSNCFQNGILPVSLEASHVRYVMDRALEGSGYSATIDLEACTVSDDDGFSTGFEIDPFRRRCLLEGLDEIALTLLVEDAIDAWERERSAPGHR